MDVTSVETGSYYCMSPSTRWWVEVVMCVEGVLQCRTGFSIRKVGWMSGSRRSGEWRSVVVYGSERECRPGNRSIGIQAITDEE